MQNNRGFSDNNKNPGLDVTTWESTEEQLTTEAPYYNNPEGRPRARDPDYMYDLYDYSKNRQRYPEYGNNPNVNPSKEGPTTERYYGTSGGPYYDTSGGPYYDNSLWQWDSERIRPVNQYQDYNQRYETNNELGYCPFWLIGQGLNYAYELNRK